ncbi:MAG TPA: hypothetical protein VK735_04470 [Pseudonocardia sp.]|uniref:hypothetical protein n=1 Tax=Pseudonocardia sp. TaxID=60912 RepID=UPI002C866529|nr:hypothetical protein [Pseudonocardia sp.]HTF46686.1 hypothetical protein [Pseudonocardia sp.]
MRNALATIVWAVLFTGVGYGFGGGIERLLGKSLSVGRLLRGYRFPLQRWMGIV